MAATGARWRHFWGACLAFAVLGPPQGARAQFNLDWHTIDGGGQTFSTGGAFSLGGTVSQPDAGTMSGGEYELFGGFWFSDDALSAAPGPLLEEAPLSFRVTAASPNPFRDACLVCLDLPEGMPVRVLVFDPAGGLVRAIQDGWLPAGRHTVVWNGLRDSGQRAPAGVYLLQVRAGRHESHHRMVFLQ